ncbi:MAG: RluA family pseudouridine synthase [Bacilli bacterium]|nr:RluA family pseudouridine synthase [Bacilli bacterium]MDD4608237.1 RluA family pseudouridine synthase [Bacilli bacterium]
MDVGNQMIKVLYEDNHLLVVEKPINIPVQADESKDLDLLTMLKQYIKDKYQKPGNVYLGLVHRLDRPVGGVMVFAKTSKCASRLSEQVRTHQIEKEYHAVVMNKTPSEGKFYDKLLKNRKTNIVTVDERGKEAILNYKLIEYKENMSLVKIDLITGRSHQIRVQFASRNYPLYGDQKYNMNSKVKEQIALYATSLTILHPTTKEVMTFKTELPNSYPWKLFNNKDLKK